MPALRHASMSSVPAGAVSFLPSTVKVTSAIRLQRPLHHGQFYMFSERARFAVQVIFKLFAEFLHKAQRGHCGRIAQWSEGAAHHVLGQVLNVIDVFRRSKSCMEARERLLEPVSAFA